MHSHTVRLVGDFPCTDIETPFLSFQKNVSTIDTHVSDYQQMIDVLQVKLIY